MKATVIAACAAVLAIAFAADTARAQGKTPPEVNPTHFKCYRVTDSGALKQPPAIKLKDQFGSATVKLGKVMLLCAPVDKNGEGLKDEKTHLTCYTIEAAGPNKKVMVTHQFGAQVLVLSTASLLCLPSTKKI